jgi:hypothetical protein
MKITIESTDGLYRTEREFDGLARMSQGEFLNVLESVKVSVNCAVRYEKRADELEQFRQLEMERDEVSQ